MTSRSPDSIRLMMSCSMGTPSVCILAARAEAIDCSLDQAKFYRREVFEDMGRLRQTADELETLCSSEYWPYPSYGDLLFSIK